MCPLIIKSKIEESFIFITYKRKSMHHGTSRFGLLEKTMER